MSVADLRPRSAAELIDVAFRLWRRHLGAFTVLGAAAWLPLGALAVVGALGLRSPALALLVVLSGPLGLLAALWFALADAAMILAAADAYHGRAWSAGSAVRRTWTVAGDVLRASSRKLAVIVVGPAGVAVGYGYALAVLVPAARRWPPLAVQGVVVGLALLALALCVTWVAFYTARYALVPATIVIEEVDAAEGVERSHDLTRGRTRAVLGALSIAWTCFLALQITLVAATHALPGASLRGGALAQTLAQGVSAFLYPLINALVAALYFDLRVRAEGYDLHLLTRELGPLAPPTAA
jgi:hypothetical protein